MSTSNSVPASQQGWQEPQTITDQQHSPASPRWLENIPGLLRALGAAAVLFALYNFLFKGWESSNDVTRYLMLLGHTSLLAVAALLSGRFFQEGKGPRLLLKLALVSVTVNFSILGAFLLSASGNVASAYPQYLTWTMQSLPAALALTALSAVVLVPVVAVGFKALARGMSQRMTAVYLLGNFALLMPLRDPLLVTALATLLSLYTLFISAQTQRQRTEVKTTEGMLALVLQFLPVAVLLGRNIWLYSPDALMLAALSVVIFIALRQVSTLIEGKSAWHFPLEAVSALAAMIAGLFTGSALYQADWHTSAIWLLSAGFSAGLLYELSTRAKRASDFYRLLAILIFTSAALMNMIFHSSLVVSLISLALGIAMIVSSYYLQQRALLRGGILLMVYGLIEQLVHAFQWFDFSYWVGLALLGVVAILLASLLESKGNSLKKITKKYWQSYRQ